MDLFNLLCQQQSLNRLLLIVIWHNPLQMQASNALSNESLYQIPSCTICLSDLGTDLASLSCGHVFHLICISQHFQYKGTCPNCQKRACSQEIRQIVFPLQENTKANAYLRTLITGMDESQGKQVEHLLKEIKTITEANDKLRNDVFQNEREIKAKTFQIQKILSEHTQMRKQNQKLTKTNQQLLQKVAIHQTNFRQMRIEQIKLRDQLDQYRQKEREYDQLKSLKRIMSQKCQDIINYKAELQAKYTPHGQMCKLFFDMVLIKQLEVLKLKEKAKDFPQLIAQKQDQIEKLKSTLDDEKKKNKQIVQVKNTFKKKYETLKEKYRFLLEKAQKKQFKIEDFAQQDDSLGFGVLNAMKSITEDPPVLIQSTLTKNINTPKFSSFGGMKKKSDQPSKAAVSRGFLL